VERASGHDGDQRDRTRRVAIDLDPPPDESLERLHVTIPEPDARCEPDRARREHVRSCEGSVLLPIRGALHVERRSLDDVLGKRHEARRGRRPETQDGGLERVLGHLAPLRVERGGSGAPEHEISVELEAGLQPRARREGLQRFEIRGGREPRAEVRGHVLWVELLDRLEEERVTHVAAHEGERRAR
jgi:hypothetical protein